MQLSPRKEPSRLTGTDHHAYTRTARAWTGLRHECDVITSRWDSHDGGLSSQAGLFPAFSPRNPVLPSSYNPEARGGPRPAHTLEPVAQRRPQTLPSRPEPGRYPIIHHETSAPLISAGGRRRWPTEAGAVSRASTPAPQLSRSAGARCGHWAVPPLDTLSPGLGAPGAADHPGASPSHAHTQHGAHSLTASSLARPLPNHLLPEARSGAGLQATITSPSTPPPGARRRDTALCPRTPRNYATSDPKPAELPCLVLPGNHDKGPCPCSLHPRASWRPGAPLWPRPRELWVTEDLFNGSVSRSIDLHITGNNVGSAPPPRPSAPG